MTQLTQWRAVPNSLIGMRTDRDRHASPNQGSGAHPATHEELIQLLAELRDTCTSGDAAPQRRLDAQCLAASIWFHPAYVHAEAQGRLGELAEFVETALWGALPPAPEHVPGQPATAQGLDPDAGDREVEA